MEELKKYNKSDSNKTSSSINYVPQAAGNYSVNLHVKDKLITSQIDTQSMLNFIAYNLPQISEVNLTGIIFVVYFCNNTTRFSFYRHYVI